MHVLEVGKPYHPNQRTWPEALHFDYRSGDLELVWFVARPKPDEVQAVRTGPADLALYVEGAQVFLCSRFGPAPGRKTGLPWSDAPYCWHRTREAERTLPPAPESLGPETRALLQIVLVDAAIGDVLAIRAVSLSPEFTRTLFAAIRDQAAAPHDPARYNADLALIHDRKTSGDLAAAAAARCRGGE